MESNIVTSQKNYFENFDLDYYNTNVQKSTKVLIFMLEETLDIPIANIDDLQFQPHGDEYRLHLELTIGADSVFLNHCKFYKLKLESYLFYSTLSNSFMGILNLKYGEHGIMSPLTDPSDNSDLYLIYHPSTKNWELISYPGYLEQLGYMQK